MIQLILSVALFVLLGVAYVKGYDIVKSRSPRHLPQFYLIMTTIRLLLVGTMAAVCIILAQTKEEAVRFAAIYIIMYVIMMVVTLKLRN